jgi:hypothetical protein
VARQKPADAAKAKAAKQKKIAIGLGVILALAMAYAVNTMMSLNGGGSKPVAAPVSGPTTPPVTAPTTVTPPAASAAPTLAGSLGVVPAAPATDSSGLVAAVTPPAGPGQLESFSRFDTKDPFAGGAPSGSSVPGTGSKGSGSGSKGTGKPPAVPPAPPSPPPTSAVISINGVSESINAGSNFPAASANPSAVGLFQLVSLTATTATISVVGGSYASGSSTLTLRVNKPVTLVNTADGTRYTLVLYPQGTVPPAGAASSGAPAAAPAAPPATTTTSG